MLAHLGDPLKPGGARLRGRIIPPEERAGSDLYARQAFSVQRMMPRRGWGGDLDQQRSSTLSDCRVTPRVGRKA